MQSVHYKKSYIKFPLCYVYVINLVDLTPIAYSRLRDLRSVRHPSLVANPCPRPSVTALLSDQKQKVGKNYLPRGVRELCCRNSNYCKLKGQDFQVDHPHHDVRDNDEKSRGKKDWAAREALEEDGGKHPARDLGQRDEKVHFVLVQALDQHVRLKELYAVEGNVSEARPANKDKEDGQKAEGEGRGRNHSLLCKHIS
jgi:hypothetical protein